MAIRRCSWPQTGLRELASGMCEFSGRQNVTLPPKSWTLTATLKDSGPAGSILEILATAPAYPKAPWWLLSGVTFLEPKYKPQKGTIVEPTCSPKDLHSLGTIYRNHNKDAYKGRSFSATGIGGIGKGKKVRESQWELKTVSRRRRR